MRDQRENETDPETAAAELKLQAEGFDFEDDRWIEQLRRAESAIQLGTIGEFEVQAEIGRGAQGVVYKAIQPHTKRHIAIKRLAGGSLAGADNSARLRREVEAAAALDHPAIVTVYGMDFVDGQPVLALEWIEGEPVDVWSDRIGRDRRQIQAQIDLFLQICAGIEHAHERGIIHRDIKPTNILVTAQNHPRVLDFGLAKFTVAKGVSNDLTVTGGFVGTPAYAAPERLAGARGISEVRSDVYSLGAVLYRMLTGRLPQKLDVPLADFVDARRWSDPTKPSAINPALNAELDAILLTALAVEPDRRYASVDKLADDLRRHLQGLPISAAPSSIAYRFKKTIRRHKAAVATGAAIALILIAAAAVAVTLAVQASRARAEAHERSRIAERINAFLTDDLLAAVDPARTDNPNLTVREVLDRAVANVEGRFSDQPLVEASIRNSLGDAYRALGLPREAIPQLERASALYDATLGPANHDSRRVKRDYVAALFEGTRSEEALPIAESLLALDMEHAGDPSEDTMATRHLLAQLNPDIDRQIAMYKEIIDWRRRHLGDDHPETLSVMRTLANVYIYHERLEQAEPLVFEIWETMQRRYEESHPDRLKAMSLVTTLYGKTGRHEEALPLLQESVRIQRETKPENFFGTGIMLGHLGQCLIRLERFDEAKEAFLEGHAILSASLGPEAGWTQGVARMLGDLYERTGDSEQAAAWRQRLLPEFEQPTAVQPPRDEPKPTNPS